MLALLGPGAEQQASTPYFATLRGSKVPRLGIVHGEFKYLVTRREGVWDGRLLRRDREEVDLSAPAPHVAAKMRERLEGLMQPSPLLKKRDAWRRPGKIRKAVTPRNKKRKRRS